ncbi:hypothetical protein T492DRAFT_926525 [Pavlovales sp. CCMP2436]|nr:hypothetical protein T492DRAFT_926525 [Pavlovales sp. CCMP2436]
MSGMSAILLVFASSAICSAALVAPRATVPLRATRLSVASMPRQLIRASANEEEGYGPIGSLLRQGPTPFVQRLISEEKYQQSVLYFRRENPGCSQMEAQGNMDAYLANPNDWAIIKMKAKKGGYEPDFANMNLDPKTLALTAVWSSILAVISYRMIAVNIIPLLTQ